FFWIFGLKEQELSSNQVRNLISDDRSEEHDTIFQKAGEDIVGALPPPCLLNNDGNEIHTAGIILIFFLFPSNASGIFSTFAFLYDPYRSFVDNQTQGFLVQQPSL